MGIQGNETEPEPISKTILLCYHWVNRAGALVRFLVGTGIFGSCSEAGHEKATHDTKFAPGSKKNSLPVPFDLVVFITE